MKLQLLTSDFKSIPGFELMHFEKFRGVSSFSIDTRTLKKGAMYIAIQGDKFDGHNFVKDAVKKGAAAVVVEKSKLKKLALPSGLPCIAVDNSVKALGLVAFLWRNKLKARVISLTGSNGKTTTKDMLVTILSQSFKVAGTVSNNNNHIGVPLTILSASEDCECLVLEQGTNHFGEIAYTASIARPDIALITNIGASHLEFLGSIHGVRKEKQALLEECENHGGTVFINMDDKLLKPLAKQYSSVRTFGAKAAADVCYKHKGFDKYGLPKVEIKSADKSLDLTVPLYGRHNGANLAAAVAVALELGMGKGSISAGVKQISAPKHRLAAVELPKGILIDDTYNANPASMASAIDVLRNIKAYKNRWVILGDMFELGDDSEKLHRALAPQIMKNKNVRVFTIGVMMHALFLELKKYYVPVWHFKDRASLQEAIAETDFNDSVILVKGSRGMRMEEFVQNIVEKSLK